MAEGRTEGLNYGPEGLVSKVYPDSRVISSECEQATAYLCKACFRRVEKLIKLRQDAVQRETQSLTV